MRPLILLALLPILSSCNLMEALHQTSPGYRNPVPFSDPWFQRRSEARHAKRMARMSQAQRDAYANFLAESCVIRPKS
jgi:hypothetical protein